MQDSCCRSSTYLQQYSINSENEKTSRSPEGKLCMHAHGIFVLRILQWFEVAILSFRPGVMDPPELNLLT